MTTTPEERKKAFEKRFGPVGQYIDWSKTGGGVKWLDAAPPDYPARSDFMIMLITILAHRVPLDLFQDAVDDALHNMRPSHGAKRGA